MMLLELWTVVTCVSSFSYGVHADGLRYFAYAGNNVSLPCDSQSGCGVDWTFAGSSSSDERQICFGGSVPRTFRDKYQVEIAFIAGRCNLIINNVDYEDTGDYRCAEDAGMGLIHTLKLDVYDTSEIRPARKSNGVVSFVTEVPASTTTLREEVLCLRHKYADVTEWTISTIAVLGVLILTAVIVVRLCLRRQSTCCSDRPRNDEEDPLLGPNSDVPEQSDMKENQVLCTWLYNDVTGVSLVDEKLFYVMANSASMSSVPCHFSTLMGLKDSQIKLDDIQSYHLPNHMKPSDMAGYTKNWLFIVDDNGGIVRFNTDHERMELLVEDCSAKSVSITHDGNVLVGTWCQTLVEYASGGWVTKEPVKLPQKMNVSHAVKTKRNTYIVAHNGPRGHNQGGEEYSFTEDTLHDGVSEVDASGRVIHTFGVDPGGGKSKAYSPLRLAIYENGLIYVTDSGNKKHLPIDDQQNINASNREACIVTLTELRGLGQDRAYNVSEYTLHDKVSEVESFGGPRGGGNDRVNRPSHLAIDEHGHVFVADSGNKRVLVLNDKLELLCELVTAEQPRRLCYVEKNHHLIVGFAGGKILMCNLCNCIGVQFNPR